ncbi:MAG: histidine phosphatase family protein [Eubacteriales bacterium]
MNIYLLRHAQSEGNRERRFYGVKNTPLSAHGRESLDVINAFFKDIAIDKIYCSPLERCVDTAKLSFGQTAKLNIDDGLKEINFGDWEGRGIKEIMQTYPEMWEAYQDDWKHMRFPNGDAIEDYQKRAQETMARILDETEENATIALVSHNGFIKSVLSYLLAGDASLTDRLSVQNATVNWVIREDGETKLKLLNYLQRL